MGETNLTRPEVKREPFAPNTWQRVRGSRRERPDISDPPHQVCVLLRA